MSHLIRGRDNLVRVDNRLCWPHHEPTPEGKTTVLAPLGAEGQLILPFRFDGYYRASHSEWSLISATEGDPFMVRRKRSPLRGADDMEPWQIGLFKFTWMYDGIMADLAEFGSGERITVCPSLGDMAHPLVGDEDLRRAMEMVSGRRNWTHVP